MLSERDIQRLEGVHPDLVRVVEAMGVCCPLPFTVLEGMRTIATQAENVASGASQTMNSRHLTGHAVDLAPLDHAGVVTWNWDYYYPFADCMKGASAMCQVPVEWGGDWETLKDGVHWQLSWVMYPAPSSIPFPDEPIPDEPVEA